MPVPSLEHSGTRCIWCTLLDLFSCTGLENGRGRHQQVSAAEVVRPPCCPPVPASSACAATWVVCPLEANVFAL